MNIEQHRTENNPSPKHGPSAYYYAGKLYDEGAAVLPYKNNGSGLVIVKGHRQAAVECDAPGNLLEDFRKAYNCEPDGWAVLTGVRGYVVLDCEDSDTFSYASRLFPSTRKTFGSKGGHIHLLVDAPIERRQYFRNGQLALEVLSNWLVSLPGSIHRKTHQPYVLLNDAPLVRMAYSVFEEKIGQMCAELGLWR